jgi:hypothetical protein
MVTKNLWQKPFNYSDDFVVNKPFKLGGAKLVKGEPVPKVRLSPRRMRQLYDQRYVAPVPSEAPEAEQFATATETGTEEQGGTPQATTIAEPPATATETPSEAVAPRLPVVIVHKGGGWYNVVRGDEVLNDKSLKEPEAQAMADTLNADN